MMFC